MMTNYIIDWLDEKFPNQLPIKQVTEFELGVLVGNRQVVEDLKIKLKIEEEVDVNEVK